MQYRKGKLIVNNSGGTSSKQSKTYKVCLPNSWVKELGLSENNRELELRFDGKSIIISQKESLDEYIASNKGNELLQLDFYNFDTLCTSIIADYTTKTVRIENKNDDIIHLAFGKLEYPTWENYLEFLEERCIPKSRMGIKTYLEVIGVDEYNPLDIIMKTEGRMAEDHQWLKVKKL